MPPTRTLLFYTGDAVTQPPPMVIGRGPICSSRDQSL